MNSTEIMQMTYMERVAYSASLAMLNNAMKKPAPETQEDANEDQ